MAFLAAPIAISAFDLISVGAFGYMMNNMYNKLSSGLSRNSTEQMRAEMEKCASEERERMEQRFRQQEETACEDRMMMLAKLECANEERERMEHRFRQQEETACEDHMMMIAKLESVIDNLAAKQKSDPRCAKEVREDLTQAAVRYAKEISVTKRSSPTVLFCGPQNVGKTSLINRCFGTSCEVDDGKTTMDFKRVFVSPDYSYEVWDSFGSNDNDIYSSIEAIQKIAPVHVAVICSCNGPETVSEVSQICKGSNAVIIMAVTKQDRRDNHKSQKLVNKYRKFFGEDVNIFPISCEPYDDGEAYGVEALKNAIEEKLRQAPAGGSAPTTAENVD